jgi:uncharacterized membrane protein YfcA
MRALFEALQAAAVSHALWEREMATNILRSKRRLFVLALLLVPIAVVSVCYAAPLPSVIGGKETYAPVFFTPTIFVASILVGLCAGLITGCIGAGGGFVITPALMSVGVKGILAVGTDLFHIFAKAIMGTAVHKKLGNVSVKLAVAFLVGSGFGATLGGTLNRALYKMDPVLSDTFINVVYVVLLGFLGIYATYDYLSLRKASAVGAHVGDSAHGRAAATKKGGVVATLQGMKIPPLITFDEDLVPGGKKIPALFVAIAGAIVGLAAAIMGVGGGFLTFPIFVYVLGVSSFTTVGTDILQIIFTAGWACVTQYAIYGFIFYTLAMGMLVGSLLGIQVGALTTKVVKGIHIRGFYAITILAGFINRLFALPGKLVEMKLISLPKGLIKVFDFLGFYVFFIVVGVFAVWVMWEFFGKIGVLRGDVAPAAESTKRTKSAAGV